MHKRQRLLSSPRLVIFAGGIALSPFVSGSSLRYLALGLASASLIALSYRLRSSTLASNLCAISQKGLEWFAVFAFGIAFGVFQVEQQLAKTLPSALDKQKIVVTIELNSLLSANAQRSVWRVKLTDLQCAGASECALWRNWLQRARQEPIRLAWYGDAAFKERELWQLELTLRRPRGFVNPKGFDYAAWLLQQGFVATAYSSDQNAKRLANSQRSVAWVSVLNQWLAHRLARELEPDSPSAIFFEGLLLGRRDNVPTEAWQTLQRTGTNHLFAISGLHIGLVALLGFGLVRGAIRLARLPVPWLLQRHLPIAGALLLATTYAVVSGLSLPTQRALVVVVLAAFANGLCVQVSLWRLWAWALVVVLVSQPLAATNGGFWLSFLAVAILLWFFAGRSQSSRSLPARCLTLLKAQLALAVGLALPLWWLGLPVSLSGPWVNLVAVPLVSIIIVPGLLLWTLLQLTPLGAFWLQALAGIFDSLWYLLETVGQWDAGLMLPIEQSPWSQALAALWALAALALLSPKALQLRVGAACLLLILSLANMQRLQNDTAFEMVVLDVGQGLAVVLKRGQQALVFDTGMAFSPEFNAGSHIVAPYLTSHGLRLDTLVVSHGDLDHKGGAEYLFDRFAPPRVFAEQGVALGFPSAACKAQRPWQWHGVRLQFIWPKLGSSGPLDDNNRSCVLLVEYGETRFLLPGDIEAVAEAKLVAAGLAPVNVLVAPHHGSKTSSTQSFLEALQPAHVVVSAGYKSRYGHPHATVLTRFERMKAQVWTTAEHGAVTVRTDGKRVVVASARLQLARRWFAQ